jgi:spermidine synthase
MVMVLEVLGSRMIGPFFGVSLFVWTSLITVTLLALAGGYALGGWLADRRDPGRTLSLVITLAGGLTMLIPLLKKPVLTACLPLGLRLGALAGSLLLFGGPLFLLGCVSPLLVRIATVRDSRLGRTVGGLYALSTLGSLAGTVLTGFYLIAWAGVDTIVLGCGVILVMVGGIRLALGGVRAAWLALLFPSLLLLPREATLVRPLPGGGEAVRLVAEDTFYGSLRVVEYRGGGDPRRDMLIDGQLQSSLDAGSGLALTGYTYLLQFLPWEYRPGGQRCLVVGLGAGIVPTWYHRRGVPTDVVDINPRVVALAGEYFGWRPSGLVAVEDARYFLERSGASYDYILLDVFNGDTTPAHLISRESFALIRSRLAPGGVLALNLAGSYGPDRGMTLSVLATLREVFPLVEPYPLFPASGEEAWGNLVVVAATDPTVTRRRLPWGKEIHPDLFPAVAAALDGPVEPPGGEARLLTDDYQPADILDIVLKERCRRAILRHTDWDTLL